MANRNIDSVYKLTKNVIVKLPYKDLDFNTGLHFRQQSSKFIKPGINNVVIFDFSDVHLIDEHGLAAIMSIWSECSNKNIKLIFCNLNESLLLTMKSKAIDLLVDIVHSKEEATVKSVQYTLQMKDIQDKLNNFEALFGSYETTNSHHDENILVEFKDKKSRKAV